MALTPLIVNGELSIPADQLDAWADVYFEAKSIGMMRVPLSVFLSDPMRHIAEGDQPGIGTEQTEEFLPLLPRQAEVATRIQEQWEREEAQRSNHLTLVVSR